MIVVLDNIRSAYNVGSIIRTSDALGIKELHLCGITPSPNDPKVTKTSLGAEDNLIIKECGDTYHHLQELKKKGCTILGLELDERAVEVSAFRRLNKKNVLVIGNEVSGLSSEILNLCGTILQIKMKGIKESMNVAVAFGIAAYELTKDSTSQ